MSHRISSARVAVLDVLLSWGSCFAACTRYATRDGRESSHIPFVTHHTHHFISFIHIFARMKLCTVIHYKSLCMFVRTRASITGL